MAATRLPGFLKKKKMLDDPNLSPAACRTYGFLFLEAGWLADALDFFLKGNVADGLDRLQELALETGDAFLLERLLQGREAPDLWRRLAEQARARGKDTLARWAASRAGLEPAAAAVDPSPARPPGDGHADPA